MPDDWEESSLGEVAQITIGRTPPRDQPRYWTTDLALPFCTIADMTTKVINPVREGVTPQAERDGKAKRVPSGALLMSFKLTIGKVGFAARDIFPNEAIAWLRVTDERLDERFLALALEAQDLTAGSGRAVKGATLNSTSMNSIPLRLPSLPVQRRIVDLIGALDAQIEALDAERVSVTQVLLLRRELLLCAGPIARGGDCFDILMGRQRSPLRATGPSMTRYLRAANVKDGRLELTDVKEMDFSAKEREQFGLVQGDVLVSEGSGSAEAVGASARFDGELPSPVCFQNTLLRYRAVPDVSRAGFVYHWCRWAYESGAFREVAQGTNILHIGSTRAVEMPVNLPTLARQGEVAESLDDLERVEQPLLTEVSDLRTVRVRLLSALLSGGVEIPESYDSLLEVV